MNGRHLALFTLLTVSACLLAAWSPADEPAKAEKPAADSMLGNEAGNVRDDNGLKMKLVWCPPGLFTMQESEIEGLGPKQPSPRIKATTPHKVFLTRGYWLAKYEASQAEWKEVMKTEPWKGKGRVKEGNDYPATWISWDDAMEFCGKLTERESQAGRLSDGWEYTLPTEAQWERGCRARTETEFGFGDDESNLGEYAWFYDNTSKAGELFAHRVGQKKPNPWGLHDMHGNVFEWCRDFGGEKLQSGRDPEVTTGMHRLYRGGYWGNIALFCGSSIRLFVPTLPDSTLGFRVALSEVRERRLAPTAAIDDHRQIQRTNDKTPARRNVGR